MRKQAFKLILLGVFMVVLASGCQGLPGAGGAQTAATPLPPSIADTALVVEGRLVPRETVELAFDSSGEVADVLVAEGDVVQAGQVLARLGNREPLESSLANARLELAASEQELLSAQQALEQLQKNLPEDQTAALQALTSARDALRDAERNFRAISSPAKQPDIDEARANLLLAEERLKKAREDYEPYENRSGDNLVRAALLSRLASAQRGYDAALRLVNALTGVLTNEFNQAQAESELKIAQSRLELAQQEFDLLQNGPDPDDVRLVEARIATAEQRIAAAQSAIVTAEAALNNLDLVATINGTVISLDLISGQRVAPGAAVARLADFSTWYVETDNLTELDVVEVATGQQAVVTADALPELEMQAVVERIGDLFEEKRGDVTYTVRLKVSDIDPRLRWGMTVVVRFSK